jgi:hypothetical protein
VRDPPPPPPPPVTVSHLRTISYTPPPRLVM